VSTVKVRTRFQPTTEVEVDAEEAAVLKHQGLLWSGTDKELAALHDDADLPAPGATAKPTGASASATDKKEGGAS